MKFVNFFHEGAVRTGLLGPAGVVDLAAADLWHGSAPVDRRHRSPQVKDQS
jgi:hypothetical protein